LQAIKVQFCDKAFHFAAEFGHLDFCKLIIESIDDKNPKDNKGKTPLHRAARHGYLDICKLIIENVQEKNPGLEFSKYTPLHMAAEKGHVQVCKLIIENVHEKNPLANTNYGGYAKGWTPLDLAARNGHLQVCQLIVENVKENHKEILRHKPVQEALKNGHKSVAAFFFSQGFHQY
jgi:ankyrin repeat protein